MYWWSLVKGSSQGSHSWYIFVVWLFEIGQLLSITDVGITQSASLWFKDKRVKSDSQENCLKPQIINSNKKLPNEWMNEWMRSYFSGNTTSWRCIRMSTLHWHKLRCRGTNYVSYVVSIEIGLCRRILVDNSPSRPFARSIRPRFKHICVPYECSLSPTSHSVMI